MKWFGRIVKPDSSDPGLPDAKVIPIEADHESISKPTDKLSEIYVHIRDFLSRPNPKVHKRVQIISAISQLEEHITAGNERVLGEIRGALSERGDYVQCVPANLIDAETQKRLSTLRRSRFFVGYDVRVQAQRLAKDVTTGELSGASAILKIDALAWCARILANSPTTEEAERILSGLLADDDTNEVRVARAFVTAAHGNRADALSMLAEMSSGLARTASLFIVSWQGSVEDTIQWFDTAVGSMADLDSDGKFLLLQHYLKVDRWDEALNVASSLSEEDFSQTPALFQAAAVAHLVQAVVQDLRPLMFRQGLLGTQHFPLAADEEALKQRRHAQDLFSQGAEAAYALGCLLAGNVSADRGLWLRLRDPAGKNEAKKVLERSLSEQEHALRRLPLALQFGLKLDLAAVERELNRETALSGGKSVDAAVARLAMALAKDSPRETANYIAEHKDQLIEYYRADAITAIEIEMLARSGHPPEAGQRLLQLERDGYDKNCIARLRGIIEEVNGADPVQERIRQYETSHQIPDLLNLVQLLEEKGDWKRLIVFGEELFERTRELRHAELFVHALVEEEGDERLFQLFEVYPEILAQSDKLATAFSWTLYRLGKLDDAAMLLEGLRLKRDDPNDRALFVNIAIASGEWTSLLAHIEREWKSRSERTAEDIVETAKLALHVGSGRMGDLLREAATKAPDSPAVLMTCFSIAMNAGLDEDSKVWSWMQRAAAFSGEDGPVQKISLGEFMARQPDWRRRESEIWSQVTAGQLPLFGAALSLNRSLGDMYLRTALTNASQADPRRRGIILSYSGARPSVGGECNYGSIALDPCALLTLGLLGITERVLASFDHVFVPHSALGWILDERQQCRFHQPSRVRTARALQLLLGTRVIRPFEATTKADADLAAEIGDDLAAMIAEVEAGAEDGKQRVVVRSFPIFRIGSLMEEPADIADHQKSFCGCLDVVAALTRLGQLTVAEEKRARAYLKLQEPPWPHETILEQGAVLYLDDLAVTNLFHLNLLSKLATAKFVLIVPQSQVEEQDALILHDAVADQVVAILEETRRCLSDGIKSGLVRLGHASLRDDTEPRLRHHPSMNVLSLASDADALVIDDRVFNRHPNVKYGSTLHPILTTLDLLQIMQVRGTLSGSEVTECRAKLRAAGFALIPMDAVELASLLAACPVEGGVLSETAELRSVRESVSRIRMTNVLQLPQEHPWMESLLQGWLHALKAQWVDGAVAEVAAARSGWILKLVDLRGWSHLSAEGGVPSLWGERYRAQILSLLAIAYDQSEATRLAYRQWLEKAVIVEMKHHDPETYAWLVGKMGERIDDIITECLAQEAARG